MYTFSIVVAVHVYSYCSSWTLVSCVSQFSVIYVCLAAGREWLGVLMFSLIERNILVAKLCRVFVTTP